MSEINSTYIRVIGPGKRARIVKRKEAAQYAAEGFKYSGIDLSGYECYVLERKLTERTSGFRATSGQITLEKADEYCTRFAPGQQMRMTWKFVGSTC